LPRVIMDAYNDRMDEPNLYPPTDGVNGGAFVERVSFPWPDKKTGPLWITIGWCLLDERWECVSLGIDFAPGARVRPLQTKSLRSIKMGELLEYAAGKLRDRRDVFFPPGSQIEVWSLGYDANGEIVRTVTSKPNPEAADDALPKRPGRPRVPLATLQEVAQVYLDARANNQHPTKAVQEHFGIKRDRAARWVWLCRNNRLLPRKTLDEKGDT
jgi:hypothetical protein